jgi:type VI secretion system secreted protein Hcp
MSAFIKFDGIEGESTESGHTGWSILDSFSQGLVQPGSGATGAERRRGDVIVEDIQVSKILDKSSPKIAEAVCLGTIFDRVEIHLTASATSGARETYYVYELEKVMVTSYNISGSGQSEDVPMENFSLNFEIITVIYTETGNTRGQIMYTWHVEEGEA